MGDFLEETFEVKSCSVSAIIDVLKEAEDEFVFSIESEGAGSDEEITGVSSSLSGVCVEAEEGMEFFDVFGGEHGIFGGNVLAENLLEFFVLNLFF